MRSRRALLVAAALAAPVLASVTAPVPSYAAATCQGRTATIESPGGVVQGTEGDDVIVSTGGDANIYARGGNDVVCLVGGYVSAGAGDDTVVSASPAEEFVEVTLEGGADSYVATGSGGNRVYVRGVTSVQVDLGAGGGDAWLDPTTVPGSGAIDLGSGGDVWVNGDSEARVDLAAGTAGVDGLLSVTISHVDVASAEARVARVVGDGRDNELHAHGCSVVMEGGAGRDELVIVGGGEDRRDDGCRHERSRLLGQGGPDLLRGRGGDDVLLGGRGRDVAKGSFGTDRCVAEVEKNCER